jgi:hypothetical protein
MVIVEEKNFEFKISQQLIKVLEKQSFELVSKGGPKRATPTYPIGEKLDPEKNLIFRDKISFGTISPRDEFGAVLFKGMIQINIPHKKQEVHPVVGNINFNTGIGSYSFCKR